MICACGFLAWGRQSFRRFLGHYKASEGFSQKTRGPGAARNLQLKSCHGMARQLACEETHEERLFDVFAESAEATKMPLSGVVQLSQRRCFVTRHRKLHQRDVVSVYLNLNIPKTLVQQVFGNTVVC